MDFRLGFVRLRTISAPTQAKKPFSAACQAWCPFGEDRCFRSWSSGRFSFEELLGPVREFDKVRLCGAGGHHFDQPLLRLYSAARSRAPEGAKSSPPCWHEFMSDACLAACCRRLFQVTDTARIAMG